MPSILTTDNHKISIRSDNLNKDIVFFTIVKPNGESLNLELSTAEISSLSSMMETIMLQKHINEEVVWAN